MAKKRVIEVAILGDASSLKRNLRGASGDLKNFGKRAGLASGAARAFGRAIKVGAVAGIGGLGFASVKVAKDLARIQRINAQTAAAIKSTGGVANVTAGHVEKLAGRLERMTSLEAESIQEGSNLLLTFKLIRNEVGKGNDIFDRATLAMADMNVALGQESKQSAIQLGKALNDPIKGITALRRVGIQFTRDQEAQIKTLVESGDQLGAQKEILKELESQFGGSAKALGKTDAGQLRILSHELGAIAEGLVSAVTPALSKSVQAVRQFLQELQAGTGAGGRFADSMRRIGSEIVSTFGPVVLSVGSTIGTLASVLAPVVVMVGGLSLQVGLLAGGFLRTQVAAVALTAVLGALTARLAFLGAAWAVGRIAAFVTAVTSMITVVRTAISITTSLRGAMTLLTATMLTNPFLAVAVAVGAVVGAFVAMGSQTHRARMSAQEFTSTLWSQVQAMRAVRDSDLDVTEAKLRQQNATLRVKSAQQTLNRLTREGKKGSDAYRQATLDLKSAKLELARANRGVTDAEGDKTHNEEVGRQETVKAKRALRDKLAATEDAIRELERYGDKTEATAKLVAFYRNKVRQLKAALDRLENRTVKVGVSLSIGAIGSAVTGVGDSVPPKNVLNKTVDTAVAARVQKAWDNGELTKFFGGGEGMTKLRGGTNKLANTLAAMFGLQITSGYRSPAHNRSVGGVSGSSHTRGSPANPGAHDFVPPSSAALQFAYKLGAMWADIHDFGSGPHLHVSWFRKGGRARRGQFGVVGEAGPELVRFGQAARVIPARKSRKMAARAASMFPDEASLVEAEMERQGLEEGFEATDFGARGTEIRQRITRSRKRLRKAKKGKKGEHRRDLREAKRDLAEYNKEKERAEKTKAIDLKIAGIEKLMQARDAMKAIRDQLGDLASQAASAWRAGAEKGIDAQLKAQLAAISGSAIGEQLAAITGRQEARTEAEDQRLLTRAESRLARAREAGASPRTIERLEGEVDDIRGRILQRGVDKQKEAAQSRADAEREGLDQQGADLEASLNARLGALADNLKAGTQMYQDFVNEVRAILGPFGIGFEGDAEHEATFTPPAPAGKKPKKGKKRKGKGKKKRRASGGLIPLARVGELGPEDVFGDSAGRVLVRPASQSRQGTGPMVNIENYHAHGRRDAEKLAHKLAWRIATGV